MPYLRLYLPEISVAQKRQLAGRLIDTTLRTFHLEPCERDQITVQFLSGASQPEHCAVEVVCRDASAADQKAFIEDVTPVLARSLQRDAKSRLVSIMGIRRKKEEPQVDVRFVELPQDNVVRDEWAVGDALVADWNRAA